MNKRTFAILLLAAASTAVTWAQKNINLNPEKTVGFNALEHVLQKPLPNPEFPESQGLSSRFFFGAGVGIDAIGDEFHRGAIKPGCRLSGEAGYWFSPVYGLRVGADGGFLSVHKGVSRAWYGALRADYLMNFTSLLRGYNPDRKFELIGSLGVVGERVRQNGRWLGMAFGASASMQCRFNVQPSLYLYVEPRLAMLSGKRYDGNYDWRRTKADLSLNVGLGYRILTGRQRALGSTPFYQTDDDNLYFGGGAGITGMTRGGFPRSYVKEHSPFGTAFAGKMFSAESGLELSLGFGRMQSQTGGVRRFFAASTLSYVLNLNNACGGYRPGQRFQLLLSAGPSLAYTRGNIYGGASGALTGVYNVSPNWGIFVRPEIGLYKRGFAHTLGRSQAFLASASIGLRYTIGDYTRNHKQTNEEYDADSKWFLQASPGLTWRMRHKMGMGEVMAASFGKRFTPVSSWRLGLEGSIYPRTPHLESGVATLDYLSSISTAMAGYNPDRVFDLQGVLGVYAGLANYNGPITSTYGLRGGLQGNFRLSRYFDLFVEPLFLASRVPGTHSGHAWVPELRVYVGLKYRFGAPHMRSGEFKAAPDATQRNFVSVAAGPSCFSSSTKRANLNVTPTIDVMLGRWFSSVSGARITYSSDWINFVGSKHYIGSVHADYLLNATSLINRAAENRFHIIGAVGAGAGFSKDAASSPGFMTYGGLQLRYNLPAGFDVHLEPGMEFWANRILPLHGTHRRFEATARITAGVSYRF